MARNTAAAQGEGAPERQIRKEPMNTLSRVVKNAALDVTPIVWRRGMGLSKTGHSKKGEPEVDPIVALRAELEATGERQARQAYDNGYRAGEAAAKQALEGRVHAVEEAMVAAIAETVAVRQQVMRRAEEDTVRLVLAIARRVLNQELSTNPDVLAGVIRAGLEKVQGQEVYRVRVHPAHEAAVARCLESLSRGQTVAVVADATQPEGGVVFETSRGTLDASIDTQMDEIARLLTEQLEAHA